MSYQLMSVARLSLRDVIMSYARAAAEDCVDGCGLCCHWIPCWGPIACADARGRVEVPNPCSCCLGSAGKLPLQWYRWLQTHSWVRAVEGFCDTPPKETGSRGSPLKRTLKNCAKDAEVELSTSDGFWGGSQEWTQLSLRNWPLGVWPCSSEHMDNTNWTFFLSFFFFGGGGSSVTRVGGWALENLEVWSGLMTWNFQIINIKIREKSSIRVIKYIKNLWFWSDGAEK